MAQIGGLYSFFKLIFGSIINAVQHRMMLIDVINKYKHRNFEDSIKRKKIQRLGKVSQTENNKINLNNIPEEDSKIHDGGERYYSSSQNPRNIRESANYIINDIEESMSKMEIKENVIEYTKADLFYQFVRCSKSQSDIEDSSNDSFSSRYDQFTKDLNKFFKETDVINMISNIKHLKFIVNKIYSEIQILKSPQHNEHHIDKNMKSAVSRKIETKNPKLNSSYKLKHSNNDSNQIIPKVDHSTKLKSVIREPSQFRSGLNNPPVKNPIEDKIDQKPEESFDFEAISDLNIVSLSL